MEDIRIFDEMAARHNVLQVFKWAIRNVKNITRGGNNFCREFHSCAKASPTMSDGSHINNNMVERHVYCIYRFCTDGKDVIFHYFCQRPSTATSGHKQTKHLIAGYWPSCEWLFRTVEWLTLSVRRPSSDVRIWSPYYGPRTKCIKNL